MFFKLLASTLLFLVSIVPAYSEVKDNSELNFYVSLYANRQDIGTIFTLNDKYGHVYLYFGFDNGVQTGVAVNNRKLILSVCERQDRLVQNIGRPFDSNYIFLSDVDGKLVVFDRTGVNKPKFLDKDKAGSYVWRKFIKSAPSSQYEGRFPFIFKEEWRQSFRNDDKYLYAFLAQRGVIYLFFNSGNWYTVKEGGSPVLFFDNALLPSANQVYTSKKTYGRKLLGQYPSGNLFDISGDVVTSFTPHIPHANGTRAIEREAQSFAVYGGNWFVGVWPWGEVWEYDVKKGTWSLFKRFFSSPEYDGKRIFPFEEVVGQSIPNEMHNIFGQRVSSLVVYDDSLFVTTANKGGYKTCPSGIDRATCNEYGTVWKVSLYPQKTFHSTFGGRFYLRLVILDKGIAVYKNKTKLGEVTLDAAVVQNIREYIAQGSYEIGRGPLGDFEGNNLTFFRENELGYLFLN